MAQSRPSSVRSQPDASRPEPLREDAPPVVSTVETTQTAAVDPNEPIQIRYPGWRTLAQWLLGALALYGVGWLLWQAGSALTPFIVGLILAYLLSPFVNRLGQKMPRWLAILTVYVAGIVLIVVFTSFVVPPLINQVEQLVGNIPTIDQGQHMLSDLIAQYRQVVPASIQAQLDPAIASGVETVRGNIGTIIQRVIAFLLAQISNIVNIVTFLIGFLIVPIWLFYVLNDQEQGRNFIDRLLHPRIRPDFWNTWSMVNKVFRDYIRGQLILCVAIGIAVGIGLLVLRLIGFNVQYILLLSLIAGTTEFIPVLGPIIGAIPGILLALFVSPQTAVAVLLVYVVVQQLENNFLVPRIVGESVGVHPAILTVALIAMGQVFGLIGVILSAPLSAIARDLFIYTYSRLGGAPPQQSLEIVQRRTKVENPEPRTIAGAVKADQ